MGGPGHSGAEYARRYGDENQIYPDSIVPISDVQHLLKKRADWKGVVIVDDFIGSGRTVSDLLTTEASTLEAISAIAGDKLFLTVVCGLEDGITAVQKTIERNRLNIRYHVLDPIRSSETVFGNSSPVFREESGRARARDIAYKYGLDLLPDWPLGYCGCEAVIVFENKIPNNCLPILWIEKKGWRPLFRRL
jgi:hypothetical protein